MDHDEPRTMVLLANCHDPAYRTVHEAITELFDQRKTIHFATVAAELANDEKANSIGGSAFPADLAGKERRRS